MAFPPGFLDELRARLSLSDVVGRKVSLKRRSGAEYAGLCPFHNEKTPSFTVNDKKGFFYCFGCQKKGDVFNFIIFDYRQQAQHQKQHELRVIAPSSNKPSKPSMFGATRR